MAEFIKKWWAEILFAIGAICYLIVLVTDKHWYDLFMTILLYLMIGAQTTSLYYQDKIDEHQKEHIKLLEEMLHIDLK